MSETKDPPRRRPAPATTERGEARAAARRERLAEALRDNLRKRKAQIHGRAGAATGDSPGSDTK